MADKNTITLEMLDDVMLSIVEKAMQCATAPKDSEYYQELNNQWFDLKVRELCRQPKT